MNTQIMIQKNTSIQFPAVISDSFNELMDFIQKLKEDKEIVIVSMKDNLPEELKSLTDDLHADYINPLSDTFVSDLADAVSHNKFVIWFAFADYETVLNLDSYSLKGIEYILVPVTPVAQITCEYIYDIWSDKPLEFYPLGIYNAVSVWTESENDAYTQGLASVLRLGIQENSNFYEWFLGNMYEVYRDHFKWDVGMTVRDFRSTCRIANIDVSELSGDNAPDLIKLMIQAYHRVNRFAKTGKTIIYCNDTIQTYHLY